MATPCHTASLPMSHADAASYALLSTATLQDTQNQYPNPLPLDLGSGNETNM